MPEARTINEVIERLDTIIDVSKSSNSRLGYFAALYRKVTIEVKTRIAAGVFDDGDRMERLDVIFANRYLRALHQHENGERPTQIWQFAFDVTQQWWPIVLQHLLLGIHAHINLDLGIAAAQTVSPTSMVALRNDFDRINLVLADLVDDVQGELAEIWPALRLMARFLRGADTAVVNFSMAKARDAAWNFATHLAPLDDAVRESAILRHDGDLLELARLVRHPGAVLSTATKLIRLGERGDVRDIIEILE